MWEIILSKKAQEDLEKLKKAGLFEKAKEGALLLITAVFAPLTPQFWGENIQKLFKSPPRLGDLGGCSVVYSTKNCYKNKKMGLCRMF